MNMKKYKLNKEEKELIASVEAGEWKSVDNLEEQISKHRQYAKNTLRKDKRVNIRISSNDLTDIQLKAVEEGIPYQTLMTSVLHKFVTGRLIESK